MKLIQLTGKFATGENTFAKVDDEDYDYLMQWKWTCIKRHNSYYVKFFHSFLFCKDK